ncbi:hypothetical protein AB0M97_01875 [Streptomyces sp. NPDC051207]|uniref:hypothetical protein n=1 Tax=Streptomyces sp. NPDC051207 TaxID=3154641 RepID=UPI0034294C0B
MADPARGRLAGAGGGGAAVAGRGGRGAPRGPGPLLLPGGRDVALRDGRADREGDGDVAAGAGAGGTAAGGRSALSPASAVSVGPPEGISEAASASSDTRRAVAIRPPRTTRSLGEPSSGPASPVSAASGRPAPCRTSAAWRRRSR